MIENLLLQQVLVYTREQSNPSNSHRSRSTTANSLLLRQQTKLSENPNTEHLVLKSSRHRHSHDAEPTLCLIESNQENSSTLIENILNQYNQRKDQYTRFDRNLMDLILKRNYEKKNTSTCVNNGYYSRLQWLAIGLVVDRFFFYIYFTATLVSYFVTLWFIPFTHPNLTIDIHSL
jgi:hypothetical protein